MYSLHLYLLISASCLITPSSSLLEEWTRNFKFTNVSRFVPFVGVFGIAFNQTNSCEPLHIPECKELGLNDTIVRFGQHQVTSALRVNSFLPLLESGCSVFLRPLVCMIHAPFCTMMYPLPPPCKSMCLTVKTECQGVAKKIGFVWPKELDCERLADGYPKQVGCITWIPPKDKVEKSKIFEFEKRIELPPSCVSAAVESATGDHHEKPIRVNVDIHV